MIELKQRRLHLKKSFKLNEKGIIITENNILNKEEYFVKYEEINLEKRIFEKKISCLVLFLLLITLFYTIIFIGSLINSQKEVSNTEVVLLVPLILINLAFFIWFINEYKNDVYYEINNNGIFISFYNNSPNKREYEDFLNKIKENQNKKMNHNLKILN